MVQKGELIKSDTINKNGRIYPADVLSMAIEEYKERIENGTSFGELHHPSETIVSVDNISHIVTSVDLKYPKIPRKKKKKLKKEGKYYPNTYIASFQFLNTEFGKVAQAIRKDLVPSPRGIGSVDSEGIVQGDYELLAIDLIQKKDKS